MFGKKLPILGIVLIALLASGGVYAALVSYLSNTVTTSTSVVSPIALSGEVIYWPASAGVLGTKTWGSPTTSPSAGWFMLTDGTYAAHLDSGTTTHPPTAYVGAGEARVLIPLTATTLNDILGMTWAENLVTGYESHADVYFDIDDDGVAEDALVIEYAYNTGTWPLTVIGTTNAWANSGHPGNAIPNDPLFIYNTLATWIAGVTYTTGLGTFTVSGTTKVIRVEIEVDNWIVDSEAYIDDVVINTVTHNLEPTAVSFVGATPALPVFAGSEFYFNFDALNQANLEMNGDLDLTITSGLDWASTAGDEFDPVTGYTFAHGPTSKILYLNAVNPETFYPEVVKEIDLRLKIAPNVAPDTFTFDALIAP